MKNSLVCGIFLGCTMIFSSVFTHDDLDSQEQKFMFIYENSFEDDVEAQDLDQDIAPDIQPAYVICQIEANEDGNAFCSVENEALAIPDTILEEEDLYAKNSRNEIHDIECIDIINIENAIPENKDLQEQNESEFIIELPSYLTDNLDLEASQDCDTVDIILVESDILQADNHIQSEEKTFENFIETSGLGINLSLINKTLGEEDIIVTDDEIEPVPHDLINSVKKAAKKKKKLEEKMKKEKSKLFKKQKNKTKSNSV